MSTPGPGATAHGADPAVSELAGLRLSVSAVARRLGVAPATLRTWDRRYNLGPSDHSSGSHRRYAAHDVARLELMQRALVEGASPAEAARLALAAGIVDEVAPATRTPVAAPQLEAVVPDDLDEAGAGAGSVLRMPGAGRRARGLARAALALDGDTALRLLQLSLDEVGVGRTWDEVARPVLSSISDRWLRTGVGIEVEHLVSEAVITVMARVVLDAPDAAAPRPVLLGSMPGEQHALPLRVLAATLAERGVGTRQLGANLPGAALTAAIARTAPAAVFLWSQIDQTADADVVAGLPRTRPRTRCYVGGPGWASVTLPDTVVLLGSLGEAGNVLTAAAGL